VRTRLVVVGAGWLGREVHQYALDILEAGVPADFIDVVGFVDENPSAASRLSELGVHFEFVHTSGEHRPSPDFSYVIAIGSPRIRRRAAALLPRDLRWVNVIHPSAYVAPSASLGAGVVLAPFAFIGVGARIENHVVLNTFASCGHDGQVGAYSVLSPYAVINGTVVLEEGVFMGTHAGVQPGCRVGRWSSVASGASVSRDVAPGSLMAGNPARGRVMYEV
jgi:sugar O-acyltransferase (sialic acid O-acetyltransferase NeuD family)